jgi:tripartite-type tricarboxylate transporter receptor subunit TctC
MSLMVRWLTVLCFALGVAAAAKAQDNYPNRPVKLVVAFPPGGATDTFIRPLVDDLRAALGQSVVIDNRGGGGGQIGWNAVAASDADGYTVLIAENALVISQALYKELSSKFDPRKHLDAVAGLGYSPLVFGVHPDFKPNTFQEFLAYVKTLPKPVTYASAGAGTVSHLVYEVIRDGAGFPALHVPYKGGGPAMADMLAGHVPTGVAGIGVAKPHAESGKLKALAVTSATRAPSLPKVPTLKELGVKHADVDVGFWWGAYVPKGTPAPVRAKLEQAFQKVVTSQAARERMARVDTTLEFLPAAKLAAKTENEIKNWTAFIEAKGLRPK